MIEYQRIAREKRKKKRIIIGIFAAVLLVALIVVYLLCNVKTVTVEGNKNYTDKQIINLVMPSKWDYNTIFLFFKYHLTKVPQAPYLDLIEIDIRTRNEVCIQVYEKKIVGYVEYEGKYVYFDKDGIVVEISDELKDGLPVVQGLVFDKVELYNIIPVEDEAVFNALVNLSQLLSKWELTPNQLVFKEEKTIDLLFGEVTVKLGEDKDMDNKIARLAGIMPKLQGQSGVLDLTGVNESSDNITFKKVQSQEELERLQREAEEAENARIEEERRQQEEWDREWAEEHGEEYVPPDYDEEDASGSDSPEEGGEE